MTIKEKEDRFVEEFNSLDDWFIQYDYLLEMAAQTPPMPEEEKTGENLVRGCQSTVWLKLLYEDGVLRIHAESDALIVSGLLAVILYLADGETPEAIAEADFAFFRRTALKDEMSSSRTNGVRSILNKLKEEAARYIGGAASR